MGFGDFGIRTFGKGGEIECMVCGNLGILDGEGENGSVLGGFVREVDLCKTIGIEMKRIYHAT